MPENINELMWWALNGSILIVAFYIRSDIKEMKDDLKRAHLIYDNHEQRIIRLEVSCKLRHGQEFTHVRISDTQDEGTV